MDEVEVRACLWDEVPRALEVLFGTMPGDERQGLIGSIWQWLQSEPANSESLLVARGGQGICGAVLIQEQPGQTAILWPPASAPASREIELRLAHAADRQLAGLGPALAQSLLPDLADPSVAALEAIGFVRLTELEYLFAPARAAAADRGDPHVRFEAYDEAHRSRLSALIEATYVDSLDCPQLNGTRHMDDVLTGYRATGQFDPDNWFFITSGGRDVGVLLLTEHAGTPQWELVYMGLVPEVRGRGLGCEIVAFALQRAFDAQAESVLLAVDTENRSAVKLYRRCGFRCWNRRVVYWKMYGKR